MKITIKLKPRGPRFKRFEFWTKVVKLTKPQGPFSQFTHISIFMNKKDHNIIIKQRLTWRSKRRGT
ncbi:hypothetical protein HanHA300_Chr16g0599161 [Helianthus annuus]|nr:hypothetical protein HanHA300_Chr16g0599161 [Helianthus annuus]KAJ0459495.1 hypothetical protein HanHA89_Chr16g0649611 [Helianthus annuus]